MGSLPLLITPLLATTLVVLTAVAGLPALLLASVEPRSRPPQQGPLAGAALLLVRSGRGTWFLNSQPIAERPLAQLLRRQRGAPATELRFQPSAALPAGAVSSSLAWLRQQSGRPVALELPGAAP